MDKFLNALLYSINIPDRLGLKRRGAIPNPDHNESVPQRKVSPEADI